MNPTAAVDPVRAQVEEALRQVVDSLTAVPCQVARRTGAAAGRMAERMTDSVTTSIALARSLGELAWASLFGVGRSAAVPAIGLRTPSAQTAPTAIVETETAGETEVAESGAADLPLEDYQSLAASQVVARLARLSRGDLRKIRDFEEANRGRRTILGKIEQLLHT